MFPRLCKTLADVPKLMCARFDWWSNTKKPICPITCQSLTRGVSWQRKHREEHFIPSQLDHVYFQAHMNLKASITAWTYSRMYPGFQILLNLSVQLMKDLLYLVFWLGVIIIHNYKVLLAQLSSLALIPKNGFTVENQNLLREKKKLHEGSPI